MNKSSWHDPRGFTLIEVLIGSGLMALLLMFSFEVLTRFNAQSTKSDQVEISKTEIMSVVDRLGSLFFNTAYFSPKEDLLAENDGLYRGLYAFSSNEYATFCKHEVKDKEERFSIVRISSILSRTRTEATLRAWNESVPAGPKSKLRISYHAENYYPFQINPKSKKVTSPGEILLIDGDQLASRRYRVRDADHVVTDRDPYDDKKNKGKTFTYTELTLETPRMANGIAADRKSRNYITNSTLYPLSTSIICVSSSSGALISRDEKTGTETVLYDPSKEKMEIDAFRVSFVSTKSSTVLLPTSYDEFPTDLQAMDCVNAAMIQLSIKSTLASGGTPYSRQKQVLLNNFNLNRPKACL